MTGKMKNFPFQTSVSTPSPSQLSIRTKITPTPYCSSVSQELERVSRELQRKVLIPLTPPHLFI